MIIYAELLSRKFLGVKSADRLISLIEAHHVTVPTQLHHFEQFHTKTSALKHNKAPQL